MNGGGGTEMMTRTWRGKDRGAEGREPWRRDERLQTNMGGILRVFLLHGNESPQSIVGSIIVVKTDT